VSFSDAYGNEIGQPQITPVSKCVDGNYVMFNTCVHIQEALEDLPDGMAHNYYLLNMYNSGM